MESTWGAADDVSSFDTAYDLSIDAALALVLVVVIVLTTALATRIIDSCLLQSAFKHQKAAHKPQAREERQGDASCDASLSNRCFGERCEQETEGLRVAMGCMPFGCPSARLGCCMATEESSGLVFVYGGVGEDGVVLPGLWVHSPVDVEWSLLDAEVPDGAVAYASLVCHAEHLYLFGGVNASSRCTSSLRLFTPSDHPEWKVIACSPHPPARFNSTLSYWTDDKFVLFGGHSHSTILLNDVWVLHAKGEESYWEELKIPHSSRAGFQQLPRAREGHSSVVVDNKLFVLGGAGVDGEQSGSKKHVATLFLESRKWELLSTSGSTLQTEDRCIGGSAHVLGKTGMVLIVGSELSGIFNAMYVMNARTNPLEWSRVTTDWTGDWTLIPGLRLFAGTCFLQSMGTMFVFGGCDGCENGVLQSTLVMASLLEATALTPADWAEQIGSPATCTVESESLSCCGYAKDSGSAATVVCKTVSRLPTQK